MSDFFETTVVGLMERIMAEPAFGFGLDDAAAIFGNAGEESGGFRQLQEKAPLVPGSRGGFGIMQWTGPRRRAYESFCRRGRHDPADINSNYLFLKHELLTTERQAVAAVKGAATLDAKTQAFMRSFLRPGIPHLPLRLEYARRAKAAYLGVHNGETGKASSSSSAETTPSEGIAGVANSAYDDKYRG